MIDEKKERTSNKEVKKEKATRVEYPVTPEEFIEAWQTSRTAQEAADKLNMPKAIAHARASGYRNMGIKLKKMERHNKRGLNIDEMNRLVEKMNQKMGLATSDSEIPTAKVEATVDTKQVKDLVYQVVTEMQQPKKSRGK